MKNNGLSYQLLVATMQQKDISICDDMNIESSSIIINQKSKNDFVELIKNGHTLKMFSFDEKGVGLSRNSALMRSDADIIQFADDDMIFVDGYEKIVVEEFEKHKKADIILFSIDSLNEARPLLKIKKFCKVNRIDALKYGCARVAARRNMLLKKNISFSLLFGGGTKYGCGEDTVFLQDCIKNGLKIFKSPVKIADVKQDSSSWFKGYNEKYFIDKGALFARIFPRFCTFYALVSAYKNRKLIGFFKAYHLYKFGIKDFKKFK